MRRIVTAVCCILWLSYGSFSGLAHTHASATPDHHHGPSLDHAHGASDLDPVEHHHHADGFTSDESASGAHRDGPLYLRASAVNPGAKTLMAPTHPAGETLVAPAIQSETRHLDASRQPRDPSSEEPSRPRAPPA